MMKRIFAALLVFTFVYSTSFLKAQTGPLLGYTEMTEVCVLIHTNGFVITPEKNIFELEYRIFGSNDPFKKITSTPVNKAIDHVCRFEIGELNPGTQYEYRYNLKGETPSKIYSFKTQPLWQWRIDPPAFRVAMGSCAYVNESAFDRPGEPYGSDYFIFDTIASKKPDMMLWLGDNIYLREADYMSKSGIIHRYNHTRALPELQKLISACPNYAIWDDHDFGPNDSNSSYAFKNTTLDAFREYWANPTYGITGAENSIAGKFQFMDIEFFLLDNRYYRTSPDLKGADKPTVLGDAQINWLIQSLKVSDAPFKIIAMGGQFLNTTAKFENYAVYPEEREKIIKLIEENNISGVIFVTGDRHCAELSELKLSNGKSIYDLTVSPLTSHAYDISKEPNTLRVEGTLFPHANFATMDFSGPKKDRKLIITLFDNRGNEVWSKTIGK